LGITFPGSVELQLSRQILCNAIAAEYGAAQLSVVAVNDGHSTYSYPERVRFEISEGDLASYRAAADYLNAAMSIWCACSMNTESSEANPGTTSWSC
jgi:hypothetical protein